MPILVWEDCGRQFFGGETATDFGPHLCRASNRILSPISQVDSQRCSPQRVHESFGEKRAADQNILFSQKRLSVGGNRGPCALTFNLMVTEY